jgi:hypothetical protein
MENKLDTINNNSMIQSEAKKNIALIKKSKEIEEQAKSGYLMNQFNLSNNDINDIKELFYKLDGDIIEHD